MADSHRLQLTVSDSTYQRLLRMCQEMGLSRSALVSLAINDKWKEEHTDEK